MTRSRFLAALACCLAFAPFGVVAEQDGARPGDWSAIREPLAALAANVPEQAAVWFAQPDGRCSTVDKGRTGDSRRDSVKTMLGQPEGVVQDHYGGSDKTAVFQRSRLTGGVFVLGKSHQQR